LDAGACALQLRAKDWPAERIAQALRALHPLCVQAGVPLIVNDHADLAPLADGLHLGQDDGPFPPDCGLRGRSTHSLEQLHQALEEGVDYVGFGPVFTTQTKRAAGDARGLAQLGEVTLASTVPVVAIGGISRENLPQVRAAGADCWAVISDILADPNPLSAARVLSQP
jgi:thiamine-phosphate diphosphorylase